MPFSATLLWLSVVTAALLNLFSGYIQGSLALSDVSQLLLSFAFFSAMVVVMLEARGQRARLVQTLTALFGASAVLYLVLIGLILLQSMQVPDAILRACAYALLLWSVAIDGFILSAALNAGRVIGFLIALLMFYLQSSLVLLMTGNA